MINIICGDRNSGKTGKIKSIYDEVKAGDGFITRKIFRDSVFYGYEIVRLSTSESIRQSLRSEFFPVDKSPMYTFGPFSFFHEGFEFADSIIDDLIMKEINPVFIDEIGPLELEEKGHYNCFQKILESERTVYFTVRIRCLENIISFFNLKNYSVINV